MPYTGFSTTKCQMYFVNFSPLKCDKNYFFDNFVYKTFAQFILDTFWCILMLIDPFWAFRSKCTNFGIKSLDLDSFSLFKCNKNSFFDNFLHKIFAQIILYTFWGFLTLINAARALRKIRRFLTKKKIKFFNLKKLIVFLSQHQHISFWIYKKYFFQIFENKFHKFLENFKFFQKILNKISFLDIQNELFWCCD